MNSFSETQPTYLVCGIYPVPSPWVVLEVTECLGPSTPHPQIILTWGKTGVFLTEYLPSSFPLKALFKQLGPSPSLLMKLSPEGTNLLWKKRVGCLLLDLPQLTPEVSWSKFLTILIGRPFFSQEAVLSENAPSVFLSLKQLMFFIKTFVLTLLSKYFHLHSVTDTPTTQLWLDWVVLEWMQLWIHFKHRLFVTAIQLYHFVSRRTKS